MTWRRRIPHLMAALSWVTMAGAVGGGSVRAAETLRINGSGIALEMMKPLVSAYAKRRPDVHIEMEKPLGSSGAVKALLADALDLVVSSKKLTPEQAARGATAMEFGQTPLAIVTEKSVPQSDITTRELEDIYAGRKTEWPGGEQIRVVMRPNTDIDTAILRGLSAGMDAAIDVARGHPGMLMAVTDPESNETVARTLGGIGASGLPGVLVGKAPLKLLSLNGVKPTVQALADGAYPLAKDIRFVTTGRAPAAVRDLLAFAYSAQGRAIAAEVGVLVTAEAPAER